MSRIKNRKTLIYNTLKEMIEKNEGQCANIKGFDTLMIAKRCRLDRTNVSRILNELCQDGLLVKSEGRPVLYKPASDFVLQTDKPVMLYDNHWLSFIGSDGSLASQVEQGVAAIAYPDGLHILITGSSGTGKTLFAKLLYQTAVQKQIFHPQAPFITFNCADYASNPQLLLAQLFGYAKGAFTGADKEQPGLVNAADNGFLFLDEIHRLPPEGQEMLYLLLDQKVYHRLGESGNLRSVNIRFVAATTENPETSLLLPFTRRIPVLINLPTLSERPLSEKEAIINAFFQSEAKKIGCTLVLSGKVLEYLLEYSSPGNIGQLRNDIKLICANALYRNYTQDLSSEKGNTYKINLDSLPSKTVLNKSIFSWGTSKSSQKSIIINGGSIKYEHSHTPSKSLNFDDLKGLSDNCKKHSLKIVVIAQGFSTATSIADTANSLLKTNLVSALNLDLKTDNSITEQEIEHFFNSLIDYGSFVVFIDTPALAGSVHNIAQTLKLNVSIVNNITTSLVIEAARLALLKDSSPEGILNQLVADPSIPFHTDNIETIKQNSFKDKVILTTCISGTGTAERVKRLLNDIFPFLPSVGCEIVCLKAEQIKDNTASNLKQNLSSLSNQIAMVIGTIDPKIPGATFIPVEDFLTEPGVRKAADLLRNKFDIRKTEDISKQIIKSFSTETLLEYLTVLNPRIAANSAHRFIEDVENALRISISHNVRLRLLVHTACMLERQILSNNSLEYPISQWQTPPAKMEPILQVLRAAAINLEKGFTITIPDDELALIADIILHKKEETTCPISD
jgi:transcriptional regulator with AAA-type ATPase domain